MKIQRDPVTGEVKTINGRAGKLLAWLRLVQPISTPIIVAATLAVPVWIVSIERNQAVVSNRLDNLEADAHEIKEVVRDVRDQSESNARQLAKVAEGIRILLAE